MHRFFAIGPGFRRSLKLRRLLFTAGLAVLILALPAGSAQSHVPATESAAAAPMIPYPGTGATGVPPAHFASAPRLSEDRVDQIAAANAGIVMVVARHPELVRHASFDSLTRVWSVIWSDPASGREFIIVRVNDDTGAVISSDIKPDAYQDVLPSMTETQAIKTAQSQQKVKDELVGHPAAKPSASQGLDSVWTVSFYDGSDEVARVLIDDHTGSVKEAMTGPQVAWQMARGYDGAFGRIINKPYIWLPLCFLFLAPFVDFRRPFKLLHLDLLVLLSFSISHYYFNQGEIFKSVPLAYPPLVYLFLRLGWIAVRKVPRLSARRPGLWQLHPGFSRLNSGACPLNSAVAPPELLSRAESDKEAAGRLHLNFPPRILFVALIALIVFRIVLNVADSNVVDVGYSGVIGAYRILHGQAPYGHMSSDDQNGDTYGPFNYLVYVPFVRLLGWSGSWDDLPAAHAAAIFFDLATIAGLYVAGRRLTREGSAGNRLGLALAFGWAAFPYTTFVQNCNVNDAIVAAFLVWGFVFLKKMLVSGFFLGLATQIKFFPAILGPWWVSFPRAFRDWRKKTLFVLGFAVAVGAVMPIVFLGGGTMQTFLDRSIRWQLGRASPFSIWGQYPNRLATVQHIGQYVLIGLAFLSYFWPRRKNATQVAAGSAALIIGFQILLTHWFYLYIPWFFPLALVALFVASGRSKTIEIAADH